jgi:hypothetical protein
MAVRAGGSQALEQPSTHFKSNPSLAKFLKRLPYKTLVEIPKQYFSELKVYTKNLRRIKKIMSHIFY